MDYLGYRKLDAYCKAQELVKAVYVLLKQFPKEEQYALCSQLRRAAVSITSNIAEGVTRYSYKDKVHFLEVSYGSLMEVMSQIEIAYSLEYINQTDLQNMELLVVQVARLLTSLQYSYMPKDQEGEPVKPFKSIN
ncbi:MAG: four helix bundle protein [Paludibacteraceae bacterium]|nr:four helix bundle protein [Paludibacteraceae bacterium]